MRLRCPLESSGDFWDNLHAVNTSKLLVSSLLFLSLAATGCEKSTDLGRMQEETLGIVKVHARDIEVLQRRADALMVRGRNLGSDAPGIADAGRYLSEARAALDQLRGALSQAPSTLGVAVKSGEVEQVSKASDELIEKLDTLEDSVRANLAAVDTWLMAAENSPRAATPPAAPSETPVAPAVPETHDGPSATGTDAGSGRAPSAPSAPAAPAPQ